MVVVAALDFAVTTADVTAAAVTAIVIVAVIPMAVVVEAGDLHHQSCRKKILLHSQHTLTDTPVCNRIMIKAVL